MDDLFFLFFNWFSGGPASTQWGREDGLPGRISVSRLPPLPWHPYGGRPRGWETSKNPVPSRHHQRQVSKHCNLQAIKLHLSVSLTNGLYVFRLIEELSKELRSKEALITELSGEKSTLTRRVGELEVQVQELSSSLLQKDKDVEVNTQDLFSILSNPGSDSWV